MLGLENRSRVRSSSMFKKKKIELVLGALVRLSIFGPYTNYIQNIQLPKEENKLIPK